uniref:Kassinin-like peptide K-III n=1 Tax=Pseudophryne guentheri TaxID=30349 RepID=TKN3_PSEGU|nr:RecName: Full=Kassinin-like peptide K-III; AltName: Full=PG-KIII [Pseudophryne guentheri]
QPHPNEFVGLM